MRRTSSYRSLSSRSRRLRVAAILVVLSLVLLPLLLLRNAGAMPMHATGGSMSSHAPVEIQVSDGLKQVLQGLLCQCGCNLDAYQCQQTMTCNVSTVMWDQAVELVDRQGKTPEQALALFASDYGEYVLASPTKVGFNLTAWVLPIVVLVVGGLALGLALRGWRAGTVEASEIAAAPIDPRYLAQIERELREGD